MSRLKPVLRRLVRPDTSFPGSAAYWERRYATGGTSGSGSYGEFAEAKARVFNRFVAERDISSVVEFGCGDGNQLALLDVPQYIGLDVSPTALRMCIDRFAADSTKSFFLYSPNEHVDRAAVFRRDAALSQEVIFHLVEDDVYEKYMHHLFDSAERYVLICAADLDWAAGAHERHRKFTDWITAYASDWELVEKLPSPQPFEPSTGTGFLSEFFLYGR